MVQEISLYGPEALQLDDQRLFALLQGDINALSSNEYVRKKLPARLSEIRKEHPESAHLVTAAAEKLLTVIMDYSELISVSLALLGRKPTDEELKVAFRATHMVIEYCRHTPLAYSQYREQDELRALSNALTISQDLLQRHKIL